jgi:hypothetical protein
MNKLDLVKVQELFNSFQNLESKYVTERINTLKQEVSVFQEKLNPFWDHIQGLKEQEAPYYNIFEVLNIRHYETKVHTPFLAHLLNPQGSHEQGSLFLDSFIKDVLKLELSWAFAKMTNFQINEEQAVGGYGRIDIIIKFRINSKLIAMAIENKIWAADQEQQLSRYYGYLSESLRLKDDAIKLVYLSPNGSLPSKNSLSEDELFRLRDKGVLKIISYKKDILNWLLNVSELVKSEKVRYLLLQYMQTLKTL